MGDSDIKILGQKESTQFLPGGQTQKVIITTFQVGTNGPFTVTQPEDGFDANVQAQAIKAKAQSILGVANHPLLK